MDDIKEVVRDGYDRLAEQGADWGVPIERHDRDEYRAHFLAAVPEGGRVLELGCGPGGGTTRMLAERFELLGVDISAGQLAVARRRIPEAEFLQADMSELSFPPETFDGVAAFFSLIHVPREEQPALLQRIATWLKPGGTLLATLGATDSERGYCEDWLGVPMCWSHFDSEKSLAMVEGAGLEVVVAQEETRQELGEPVTFLWVLARQPEEL